MKTEKRTVPRVMVWDDTPEVIRQKGYISQKDLYLSLGLSRRGLYYVLEQVDGQGYKVRRSILGKKLYLHLDDAMAALFPDKKGISK